MRQGLPTPDQIKFWPDSTADFMGTGSIFILNYSCQAGSSAILGSLENGATAARKTVDISFVATFVLEFAVGLAGYLYFLEDTAGDVLTKFPADNVLANVARAAVLFMVVPSYMTMFSPCRRSILELFFEKTQEETSWVEFLVVSGITNMACLAVALAVADLNAIFAMCGNIVTPFVAFIFPAVCAILIRSSACDGPDFAPVVSYKQMDMYAALLFGTVCLGFFGYGTLRSL